MLQYLNSVNLGAKKSFFCRAPGGPGRSSAPPSTCYSSEDVISCQLTRSVQCAHQKPITVLRAAAGRVVTGSQDHTVRVTTSTRLLTTNLPKNPPTLMLSVTLLLLLVLFARFTAWRTRAASSPCRVTLEGSPPSTSTRSEFCFLFPK